MIEYVIAISVGIIAARMLEYLFEVRVKQFRSIIADWLGISEVRR